MDSQKLKEIIDVDNYIKMLQNNIRIWENCSGISSIEFNFREDSEVPVGSGNYINMDFVNDKLNAISKMVLQDLEIRLQRAKEHFESL